MDSIVHGVAKSQMWLSDFHFFSLVQFSRSVMSDSLWPHESQHARLPCPSPTPRVHPNPYPLSRWCHPTISSSVVPFSSCPQPFPTSGSFQMSQLFASGGQSIGPSASTSVLPMNIQHWRWQEYTESLYKKDLHDPGNHWCDHSPRATHPGMWSQVGLRKHHYEQS